MQPCLRLTGEKRDDRAIARRYRPQGDFHLLEISECLEKENFGAGFNKSRDLLPVNRATIYAALLRFVRADIERTDAAGDCHLFPVRRLERDANRRAVDLRDAVLKTESRQPHRICAEGVCLNKARARRDIFLVNGTDSVRLAHAQFL